MDYGTNVRISTSVQYKGNKKYPSYLTPSPQVEATWLWRQWREVHSYISVLLFLFIWLGTPQPAHTHHKDGCSLAEAGLKKIGALSRVA